ncbi:MAG: hypothetical protein F6K09_37880 [Merismopedia sp. SIO2A8]|nr:hypothetical protein [Merismopedia sp. SIO2A8]
MLQQTSDDTQDEHIFAVVNQLNKGLEHIQIPKKRHELAQLNLVAGQRAKQSTAYDVAIGYFKMALNLLENNAWSYHYSLTLNLHQNIATTCYVRGKFDEMDGYLSEIFKHGMSLLDKIPAYEIKVQSYLAQSQLKKAVQTAIAVAKLLGINLTQQANGLALQWESAKTKWLLGRRSPAEFIHFPIMEQAKIAAAVRILASANSAAYVGQPELLAPIVSKQVHLLVKYGNLPIAAFVYAWYGTLLCGRYLQIEVGSQFGQLALEALDKFGATGIKAKTVFIVNCMIAHWRCHVSETLTPLWQSYQDGRESGDVEYASWAILVRCEHLFCMGHSLVELEREFQFA